MVSRATPIWAVFVGSSGLISGHHTTGIALGFMMRFSFLRTEKTKCGGPADPAGPPFGRGLGRGRGPKPASALPYLPA